MILDLKTSHSKALFVSQVSLKNIEINSSGVYEQSFNGCILLCLYISLLNLSKHNINEICIITFNGALLHVSASGSRCTATCFGFWEPSSGKIQLTYSKLLNCMLHNQCIRVGFFVYIYNIKPKNYKLQKIKV
jgi:hypothetical protein